MKQRLDWLDSVKAFGIMLVYIVHCNIPGVNPHIYLFHMPLFFIISGYCWDAKKNSRITIIDFAKKKYNSYIVPYFKICSICLCIYGIPMSIINHGCSMDMIRQLCDYLFGIFIYSRGKVEWLPNCSPVWFLTCLFCAEIVFHWIMRQNKTLLYVLFAGLIGYACSCVGKVFPWNIDSAFTAIPFLYLGYMLKEYESLLMQKINLIVLIPISLVIFLNGVVLVDFDGNHYENILLMYVEASIVCIAILDVFKATGGGISVSSVERHCY